MTERLVVEWAALHQTELMGNWDLARQQAPLKVRSYVTQVRVDPELGTICWPNSADLDADVLYALAAFYFHGQKLKDARVWADRLRQMHPVDQRLVGLERALRGQVAN
jgi:hypothetical protein